MTAYASVAQLIVRINLEETLSAEKAQLVEELIEAISLKIDNFCNVPEGYFVVAGLVDPDIREACLAQVAVLMKRYEGAMASSLGTSDLGILALRIQHSSMNRDVKEFLVDGRHVHPLYGRPSDEG